jgi:hypothetical protein
VYRLSNCLGYNHDVYGFYIVSVMTIEQQHDKKNRLPY